MFSISYPADEHYRSNDANGNPIYENEKQFIAAARRLVNFYVFNNSAATVYVKLQDTANGGTDKGPSVVYPVFAGSFVSVATNGGDQMRKGIYAKGFTDAACAAAAGDVLHYKVDWTAFF